MTNADTLSPMVVDGQASMSVSPLPRGTRHPCGHYSDGTTRELRIAVSTDPLFFAATPWACGSGQIPCAATDIKEALKLAGAIVAASGSRIRVADGPARRTRRRARFGWLDVGDQSPLESGAQPVLECGQLLGSHGSLGAREGFPVLATRVVGVLPHTTGTGAGGREVFEGQRALTAIVAHAEGVPSAVLLGVDACHNP
ncbi:MAG: hypothetical protein QOF66_6397 [Mycobacterium sp.]|jgi:hypothetical protein|nr:hypothetical protein [Mycobacterium sp.]